MLQEIYVLSGMPGIGKTTWAKNFQKKYSKNTIDYISRDEVRFKIVKEDEPYFSKEKQVFSTFINLINKSIAAGHSVIIDATHLNKASRNKLLWNLTFNKENTELILVIFPKNLKLAKEQNELRKGTRAYVPPAVIEKMANEIDKPSLQKEYFHKFIYLSERSSI